MCALLLFTLVITRYHLHDTTLILLILLEGRLSVCVCGHTSIDQLKPVAIVCIISEKNGREKGDTRNG